MALVTPKNGRGLVICGFVAILLVISMSFGVNGQEDEAEVSLETEKNLNSSDPVPERKGTYWISYTWQAIDFGLTNISGLPACLEWADYNTAMGQYREQMRIANKTGGPESLASVDANATTEAVPSEPMQEPVEPATVEILNSTADALALGIEDATVVEKRFATYIDVRIRWQSVCRDDPYTYWINATDEHPGINTDILCKLYNEKLNPTPKDIQEFVTKLEEDAKEALRNLNGTETVESLLASGNGSLSEPIQLLARVRRDVDEAVSDADPSSADDAAAADLIVMGDNGGNSTNATDISVKGGIKAGSDVDDPTLVVNWELANLLQLNLSIGLDETRSRQVGFKLKDLCLDVAPPELEEQGGDGVGAGSLGSLGLDKKEYAKKLKNDTAVDSIKETLKANQSSLGGSFIKPILEERQYDHFSPPKFFKGQSIEIKIGMYIESMSNFETSTMDYDMDLYLQMAWRDPRLSSNLSLPVLIKEEDLRDEIWRPDPYFSNSKESSFHEVTFLNFLMKVFPTGEVYYELRVKLKPACNLILCKYPHDNQTCHLRIESFAYPQEEVRFRWFTNRHDALSKNPRVRLPELYIERSHPERCSGHRQAGNYSCLQAVFELGRDVGFHVSQTYIPTTLALMFSWVGVFLPDEFMEGRIALAITVLLTMSTESAGAREHLPSVSYLKAIDVWFGFIMAFVFITLLQTLIVISLDKRSAQLSKWASKKKSGASELVRERMMKKSERFHKIGKKLDSFCRVFYPLTFLIFLIIYFFVITKGRQDSCIPAVKDDGAVS